MIYLISFFIFTAAALMFWQFKSFSKCKCTKCNKENCKCKENDCNDNCKCHETPSPYLNGHSKNITAVVDDFETPEVEPEIFEEVEIIEIPEVQIEGVPAEEAPVDEEPTAPEEIAPEKKEEPKEVKKEPKKKAAPKKKKKK